LEDPESCGSADYCQSLNVLPNATECFSNAQYRVDVFYDGVRVLSKVAAPTTDFGNPVAREDLQMNVGACLPPSWHLKTSLTATSTVFGTSEKISRSLSGFLLSYASLHNTYGYDMFRIYPDRDAFSGDLTTFSEAVVQYVLDLFAGQLLPSDMSAANILTDPGS
jgi:hypothetical protein